VTQFLLSQGIFPANAADFPGGGAVGMTLGFVYSFGGGFVPGTTFNANGQTLSIVQNTALFALLGGTGNSPTFGGNGTTNFALPNLVGTATVGNGTGPGLSSWVVGQTGGSATTSLTTSQLPAHDHSIPAGGVTGATGANQPFSNVMPSLALRPVIAVDPVAQSSPGVPNTAVFVGQVANFAGTYVPAGWMAANGDLLSISGHQALFNLIGTTYGGDGITTFALPDLRGRVAVGADASHPLGSAFGAELTTLSAAQMPAHNHTLPGGGVTGSTGGNASVSNYQPSLALNYLIALQGIFPPSTGSSGGGPSEFVAMLGQIVEFAGDLNHIPNGWALANGQLLSINQNQALFALLGFDYGGDGQTMFALPDFRGRTMIGADYLLYALGDVLGTDSNVLTIANFAAHNHSLALASTPEVPLPAALPLFATGAGVLGFIGWRRKKKTAALAA
jgi:microcystin-dependent protein